MTLFLLASGRIASAQDQWELEMRGEIGIPHGYVQVRENEIQGTHLDLRHDLGIETSESFGLEVVRRLRSGSDLRLSVDALLLYGSATLPGGVFFNGATLLAATTRGNETSEDFLTQELPVPLLTLRIELPIGGALSLTSVVTGGWLPSVNSLRSEGGVVRISQGHADVSIGMHRRLGAKLRLDATIQGSYFTQHEVSREDDNDPSQDRQGVSSSF